MLRPLSSQARSLTLLRHHNYIKQKDLDAIKSQHPEFTLLSKFIIANKIIALMLRQGYADFKADMKTFRQLRKIEQRTG